MNVMNYPHTFAKAGNPGTSTSSPSRMATLRFSGFLMSPKPSKREKLNKQEMKN
jgi:hypothetical protein